MELVFIVLSPLEICFVAYTTPASTISALLSAQNRGELDFISEMALLLPPIPQETDMYIQYGWSSPSL